MRLAVLAIVLLACAGCHTQAAQPAKPPPAGGEGQVCGGFASPPCAVGFYCRKSAEELRGADIPGACHARPQMCPEIYQPVCGDNGKTYPNACHAARAGVNVAAVGACAARP